MRGTIEETTELPLAIPEYQFTPVLDMDVIGDVHDPGIKNYRCIDYPVPPGLSRFRLDDRGEEHQQQE
jgi:hypothetical protein